MEDAWTGLVEIIGATRSVDVSCVLFSELSREPLLRAKGYYNVENVVTSFTGFIAPGYGYLRISPLATQKLVDVIHFEKKLVASFALETFPKVSALIASDRRQKAAKKNLRLREH
ncbi:hypothetical protein TSAR_008767 [Trichomalopsis sarcophagae]|uniref:Uncharacterized protein n=1 Tax=Trichomalopsis sarcophagae TaxID=543379 RepID=A0A232EZL5_9HYME|nr:hypothetical protein TSAR_008767 [Trichomalopsis sarcophagae]